MTNACESCGATLEHTNAICRHCESRLEREQREADAIKYICPACASTFDRPLIERWPRHAKWYVPAQMKPTCPSCQVALRDRKNPRQPLERSVALLVAAAASCWMLSDANKKLALGALLIIHVGAHVLMRERNIPHRQRYAKDGASPGTARRRDI